MPQWFSIFHQFCVLGWISFGRPTAHISYFRKTFVEKLNGLDERDNDQRIALSLLRPGPGPSQVGLAGAISPRSSPLPQPFDVT